MSGGGGPKGPSAEQQALERQQLDSAERERERLRQERISGSAALRRRQRGRATLLATEGGELGSNRSLLGG